jgi:hypothetical protein
MNSKVKIQTNKTKLDVCLKQSLVLRLNLSVLLTGLSWTLFIGGQVSRNQSGSIQTHRIWRFTYRFPYSNIIQFDFYFGPIFLWAFTQIHLRGTNITGLGSHTLVTAILKNMRIRKKYYQSQKYSWFVNSCSCVQKIFTGSK